MERGQEDQSPNGSDSLSDLSQMDEFERRMNTEVRQKQRARDERRLRNATSGRVQAFSKARAPPKLSLTMQSFEHNDGVSSGSGEMDAQENDVPTPALNIPSTWGRKAKSDNNWLERIRVEKPLEQEKNATRRTSKTPTGSTLLQDDDWLHVAAVDAILPVGNSSAEQETSTRRNRPPIHDKNTSIEEIMRLEHDEEEGYSAESPVAQASERRRRLLSRRSYRSGATQSEGMTRADSKPISPDSPSRSSLRSLLERDNIVHHVIDVNNNSPSLKSSQRSPRPTLPTLKSTKTVGVINFEVEALGEASGNRAGPNRHDSRDLLRQLARASASPTPSLRKASSFLTKSDSGKDKSFSDEPNSTYEEEKTKHADQAESYRGRFTSDKDLINALPKSRDSSLDQPRPSSHKSSKIPVVEVEPHVPTPPYDTKPDTQSEESNPKTPIVIGAWVDTPFPRRKQNVGISDEMIETPLAATEPAEIAIAAPERSQTEIAIQKPSLPQSAGASIVESLSMRLTAVDNIIGDSTLESIRDVVGHEVDYSTINVDVDMDLDDETLNLIDNINVPINQAAHDRELEDQAMQRMRERLRAVRTGLRDASRGMKRVQREIVTAEIASEAAPTPPSAHEKRAVVVVGGGGGGNDNTKNPCQHCAQCHHAAREITLSSLVADAWHYFTSFFYTWPADRRWRWLPRLTWLGLVTLLFAAWSASELTMCEYYCHPLYASSMTGYGVDINAPAMPFVAATVLLARPLKWAWQPLVRAAGVHIPPGRDFPPSWRREVAVPVVKRDWMPELRASQGLDVEGFEEGVDWSMLDDEQLR